MNRKKSKQQAQVAHWEDLMEISEAAITRWREVNIQGCNLEGSFLNKSTIVKIGQEQ